MIHRVQIASWDDNHNYYDTDGNMYRTMGDFAPSEGQWVWTNGQYIYGHSSVGGGYVIPNKVEGAPFVTGYFYGYISKNLNYKYINDNMERCRLGKSVDYFVNNYDFAWIGFDHNFYRNDGAHVTIHGNIDDIDVDDDGNLLVLSALDKYYSGTSWQDYTDPQYDLDMYYQKSMGNINSDGDFIEGHIKGFKQAYKDTEAHRTTTWIDCDDDYPRKYKPGQVTKKDNTEDREDIVLVKNGTEVIDTIDLKAIVTEMEGEAYAYIDEIKFDYPAEKIGTPPDPYVYYRHISVNRCTIDGNQKIAIGGNAQIHLLVPVWIPDFVTKRIDFDYYFYDTFHVLGFGHFFPYIEERENSKVEKAYISRYYLCDLTLNIDYTYIDKKIDIYGKWLTFKTLKDASDRTIPKYVYSDLTGFTVFDKQIFYDMSQGNKYEYKYDITSYLHYIDHDKYAEIGDFYYDMPATKTVGKYTNHDNQIIWHSGTKKSLLDRGSLHYVHDLGWFAFDNDSLTFLLSGQDIHIDFGLISMAYPGIKDGDYLYCDTRHKNDCLIKDGAQIWPREMDYYQPIQNYRIRDYHNIVQLLADITAVIEQINGGA